MKKIILLSAVCLFAQFIVGAPAPGKGYWNQRLQIGSFRLPMPPADFQPEYLDLNGDGHPDAIRSITIDSIPVLWLDDDGDMRQGDLEGDMDNDCLLLDRDKDGVYDLVVKYADMDGVPHTMCHNDINIDNILVTDTTLDIIDWEFAGYNDPAYDFGRVIAGLEYEVDEPKIQIILEAYFGRPATQEEYLHWMAYSAIHNWYYVGWALYKESIKESSRDWMLFFYKQAKKLAAWCIPQYEAKYGILDASKSGR